jgi:hypothetical protein
MKPLLYFIFMGLFAFALSAWADDTGAEKKKSEIKRTQTESFSGLKLKGQLKKPDLSYIYKRTGLRTEQIVDIPENFDDEIIQGAGTF